MGHRHNTAPVTSQVLLCAGADACIKHTASYHPLPTVKRIQLCLVVFIVSIITPSSRSTSPHLDVQLPHLHKKPSDSIVILALVQQYKLDIYQLMSTSL